MDSREFIRFRDAHKVTAETFKGQGRKVLLKEIAKDREAFLLSGTPKKGMPIVLFSMTNNSFSILCDNGEGSCQRIHLDSLQGLSDVLAPYFVANADRYGLKADKRGGRRSNAGRPSALSQDKVQKVLELRRTGYSLTLMAKEMGTSRATISRLLKRMKEQGQDVTRGLME